MRFRRPMIFLCFLVFVGLLSPLRCFAQFETATLSGRISDPQGASVPKARVEIVNIDTNVASTTETNTEGIYVFTGIKPGRYRLHVVKDGFHEIIRPEFTLNTQDAVEQNFKLQVGSVSESVTVNGNDVHMETTNPAVGLLVDRTFIENTPLNGRSFQDLIALAPGTVSSNLSNGRYSINGQHDDANYFTVDGVAANTDPNLLRLPAPDLSGLSGTQPGQTALGTTQTLASIDSLQEFKIQTSGYTAEYGRQPGGQIALTTRSGSNDIHGSAYDYFRNTAFDANDWFFNQNGIPRQAERQNDFGGTLGGPVILPFAYNGRDKTFFFFSYEGLRLLVPAANSEPVPTLAFRQFVSSGWQPFLNSLPVPNGPDEGDLCASSVGQSFSCTAQWNGGFSNPSNLDSTSFRLDQIIGEKARLFVRFADTPSSAAFSQASQFESNSVNTRALTVGGTVNVTKSLVDELRFNFTDVDSGSQSHPIAFDGAVPYPKSLGVPPQYLGSTSHTGGGIGLPTSPFISFPGYGKSSYTQSQYNLIESLAWNRGSHTIKSGGDYRRLMPIFDVGDYGTTFYANSLSGLQNGFADQAFIEAEQSARPIFVNLSVYVQDHWKLSRWLTVDYGLRWEYNPAPGSEDAHYPLALTTANLAEIQLAPRGTPIYSTTYHDFAPRIGFALDLYPLASRPLVLRGGVGLFYDTGQAQGAQGFAGYPFQATTTTTVPIPAPPSALAPPSLTGPLVPPYGFLNGLSDPHLTLPYAEEWNLSVDAGLRPNNTLTISYLGNGGRKLLYQNFYQPSTGDFSASGFNLTSNAASSSYEAMQIQDQGFVLRGVQLIASYTWAHAIDNASNDTGEFSRALARGNSDNDIRQILNAALNSEIPTARSTRFLRGLTGGWSVTSRVIAQTGSPIDVIGYYYILPNGSTGALRPDLVPGVPIYLKNVPNVLGGWALNPAAFTGVVGDGRNPPGTIPLNSNGVPLREGTLGRNFVHGPNFWNLNTGVQRVFPIHEQLHLLFRVEGFNLFNHPNAGNIDNYIADSTFGTSRVGPYGQPSIGVANQLYGTGGARSLQLMLKLQF